MSSEQHAAADEPPVDRAAVRERLRRVHDPELDRSIVELEYVDRIAVDGHHVTVAFVLPTAWCSPAFAWMMAADIRDEVEALAGVETVSVRLEDHMHGEQISTGVNAGRPFEAVFDDADDGVEAVREKLDEKARFARQHSAFDALLDAGLDPGQIVRLTPDDLDLGYDAGLATVSVRGGALSVTVDREPLAAYVEKARTTGLVTGEDDPLFADRDGEPIDTAPESFERVRRDARLADSNIEGQATICASLHEARNGVEPD